MADFCQVGIGLDFLTELVGCFSKELGQNKTRLRLIDSCLLLQHVLQDSYFGACASPKIMERGVGLMGRGD